MAGRCEDGSHRPVPVGFLAEKDLRLAAIFFELRPRQIFDPHWACYLGYISASVGFRFRLVRYSGNLLGSRDATPLFMPCANPIFGPFLEGKSALEDFKTGYKGGPTGPNSVPEKGTLFTKNGTDGQLGYAPRSVLLLSSNPQSDDRPSGCNNDPAIWKVNVIIPICTKSSAYLSLMIG